MVGVASGISKVFYCEISFFLVGFRMRVLVLGGYGAVGNVICRELVKHPRVDEVACAEKSLEIAKAFVSRYKNDKLSAMEVDLFDVETLRRAVKGFDVVINAVDYRFNLRVMKACVDAGANYQDLAFGWSYETMHLSRVEAYKKQLELDDAFREKGLVALLNTGADPGISDLIAGYAADTMDHLYEVRIKDCDIIKSKEPVSVWSPRLLWIDMITPPLVYENGVYKEVPPFSGEEVYNFPEPIGPQTCYHHAHEEVIVMPFYLKDLRYVEFKMGGPDMPFAKAIYDYGLASTKPIKVGNVEVAPLEVFLALVPPALKRHEVEEKIEKGIIEDEVCCVLLDVVGERSGKEVRATYYSILRLKEANQRMKGVTATSYMVGITACAFTELLAEGRIKSRGVAPPEALEKEERATVIRRLEEKGIVINKVEQTIL